MATSEIDLFRELLTGDDNDIVLKAAKEKVTQEINALNESIEQDKKKITDLQRLMGYLEQGQGESVSTVRQISSQGQGAKQGAKRGRPIGSTNKSTSAGTGTHKEAILKVLSKTNQSMSVGDIAQALQESNHKIDDRTLYVTIHNAAKNGFLKREGDRRHMKYKAA